jgi:phage baseplate assembly protein W
MDDNKRGWAFPIECDPLTGRIREVSDDKTIHQSIRMILETSQGERYFYRNFGCGLKNFVFGTMNYTTLKQIEQDVRKSIEEWEKRVTLLSVQAKTDSMEKVNIEIDYQINERKFNYTYELVLR